MTLYSRTHGYVAARFSVYCLLPPRVHKNTTHDDLACVRDLACISLVLPHAHGEEASADLQRRVATAPEGAVGRRAVDHVVSGLIATPALRGVTKTCRGHRQQR